MLLKKYFILVLSLLTSYTSVYPLVGQKFVVKGATGNSTGTSYTNAFPSFASINWSSLSAGDTLVIGTQYNADTTYYYEKLEVGRDNVIITRSTATGYDGVVVIDGQGTRTQCITNGAWNQFKNIEINGLNKIKFIIKNFTNKGVDFRHEPNLTIKNLTVLLDNANAEVGISFYGNEYQLPPPFTAVNYLAENISVLQDSGSYSGNQNSDAIAFYGVNGITIRNVLIKLFNNDNYPHQDMVQSAHSKNITIEQIEGYHHYAGTTLNKQGIYITDCGGDIKIRNNYIFLGNHAYGSAIAIEIYDNAWWNTYTPPDSFIITNNTVICSYDTPNAIRLVQSLSSTNFSANTILKNNIFVKGTFAIDRKFFTSQSNCDYNIFFDPNGTTIYEQTTNSSGTTRSWSTWQGYGYDANSYITNPALTGYIPNVSGDADDNGTDLSALGYSTDIDGTSRPQGAAWDIGVFELVSGGGDLTPPQIISAELIDSVTLIIEFSEFMDESLAETINNYSINNGIDVLSAIMQGTKVRLLTSAHISGLYQVTVSNVTDVAGNIISSLYNSMIYEYYNSSNSIIELPIARAYAEHWYLNYTPNKTIDGVTVNDSRWGGDVPMPDTIIFSLDDVQILNKTKISFYEWNNGRIYNYSVQVSTDSLYWNEIKTNIPSHPQEWSIEEIETIEAKFIKIILLSNNQSVWAGIWETKFLGHLKLPTNHHEENENLPVAYSLEQNYPNPFNPSTKIKFNLPKATKIKLTIFNSLGESIIELVNSELTAGTHIFNFNAQGLASGIYFYRVESSVFIETRKMVLLR